MRRYLVMLALLAIFNAKTTAQDLNSLVYPQTLDSSYESKITDIKEVPFTHTLLNADTYKNIRAKLAHTQKSKINLARTQKGDILTFHVRDILQEESWYQVESECIYVSDKLAIWISQKDKKLLSDSLNISSLTDRLTSLLEEQTPSLSVSTNTGILAIDQKYFGDPPDVDGDGRLDILLLDIIDQFEETGSYVAGFFDPVNLVDHPYSNYRDMIYIDLYPSVIYEGEMNTEQVAATIAHEYQHLIHANYEGENNRYLLTKDFRNWLKFYAVLNPDLLMPISNPRADHY